MTPCTGAPYPGPLSALSAVWSRRHGSIRIADGGDPVPGRLGGERRLVVGSNEVRHAAKDERLRRFIDPAGQTALGLTPGCPPLSRGTIKQVQQPESPIILCAPVHRILAPDVTSAN